MFITGQLIFDIWPPKKQFLVGSVKHEDRPISVIIDTSGRFVVRYADESSVISYTSQPLNVIDDGSFTFCCIVDDVTGKISVEINNIEILSYKEANGTSVAVETASAGKRMTTEYTYVEPEIVYNEIDKAFLISVKNILDVLMSGDNINSWKLSNDLFLLLINNDSLITAVSKRWGRKIIYTIVGYDDFDNNPFVHSASWSSFNWDISRKITTNQILIDLDELQFINSTATLIGNKNVSVKDIIIAYLIKYKILIITPALSEEQNLFLEKTESTEWGNSNFHGKLLEICDVVLRAVEPLVYDIMTHNYKLSHELDTQYPGVAIKMKKLFGAFSPLDFNQRHFPGFNSPEYSSDGFSYETEKIIMSYAASHMKDGLLTDNHRAAIADRILSHGKLVSTMVALNGGWNIKRLMDYINDFVNHLKSKDSLFYKNNK